MSVRIIPKSYVKAYEYIVKLDQKTNGVLPANLPFSANAWATYQTQRTSFLKEYQEYKNSDAAQQKSTEAAVASWNTLYLNVSHYIQVFNMAVARKVFSASDRAFYGLEVGNAALPALSTEAQLTAWAGNIANGETARVAAGGAAMAYPSAAEVAASLGVFNTTQQAQANAKLAANKELSDVGKVFQATVDAIMDLFAELEFANRKETPAYLRNILREYGMQYRNQTGEATEETIKVPANGKFIYEAVTLGEETKATLTLLSNQTGVKACRNKADGCVANGLELVFNTPAEVSLANLIGEDDVLVISNSSASEVEVKVKVVG